MKVGFIGLGKMGSRMALKLLGDHEVIVWNRSPEAISNFKFQISNSQTKNKIQFARTIEELIKSLDKPKIVWLMVSANAVDEVLKEVKKYVQKGDVIIDGGNSYYKDTEKRFNQFTKIGIHYLGVGTSGGILAVDNGYPFMVGGSKKGYEIIKPILDSLAKPARHASKALRAGPGGGHQYFGKGGAGHFVKMVHNGIEYPVMQGLGEGFGVLANSPYKFDLLKVAKLYQKGTLVSGFMLDRTVDALSNDPKLSHIVGVIGSASREASWTVEEAKRLGQPVASIEQAIDFRKRSETEKKVQNSFAAKIVAALRIAFGGHEVKKK